MCAQMSLLRRHIPDASGFLKNKCWIDCGSPWTNLERIRT